MIQPINNFNTRQNFTSQNSKHSLNVHPDFDRVRSKEAPTKTKIAAAVGSLAGTALGLAFYAKKQKKGFWDVNYTLREMLGVSLGGIGGAVLGGVLTSPKRKHERKIDEGIFQYSMVALPGVAVSAAMLACDKIKPLNNAPCKIAGTVLALAGGIKTAVDVSNVVSDLDNNDPDRKLKFKDAVASVDDLIGVLVLAKVKAVKKMKLDRVLPVIYAYCGYKAGTTN